MLTSEIRAISFYEFMGVGHMLPQCAEDLRNILCLFFLWAIKRRLLFAMYFLPSEECPTP